MTKTMFLIVVYASGSFAGLIVHPENTIVLLGQQARLFCATDKSSPVFWTFRPYGAQELASVRLYGGILGISSVFGRHSVVNGSSQGHYDLVIDDVRSEDAGTYTCIDEGFGEITVSAELTVIESNPSCNSNASTVEKVLVENSCGLQPDLISLKCKIVHRGGEIPLLQWRNMQTGLLLPSHSIITANDSNKIFTTEAVLRATPEMNEAEYECRLNNVRSQTVDKCLVGRFRILHFSNITDRRIPSKDEEQVECSANTSESCSYSWILDEDQDFPDKQLTYRSAILPLTDPQILPGRYVCHAQCNIRGTVCSVKPMQYIVKKSGRFVSTDQALTPESGFSSNVPVFDIVILIVLVIGFGSIIGLQIHFRIKSRAKQ